MELSFSPTMPLGHVSRVRSDLTQAASPAVALINTAAASSLLKKGTGSERPLAFVENFGLPRGACPLFQHPASSTVLNLSSFRS
jgi:hypothetical protein